MTISRQEYQALIDSMNQVSMEVVMRTDFTIADRIEELGREQPEATFLIYNDERVTYAEVNERAEAYARIALYHGLKKGDVAAMMIENRPAFFYAWFGLLKIGVTASLINTEAKSKSLTHALTVVDTKLVFLGDECLALYLTGDNLAEKIATVVIPDGDISGEFPASAVAFEKALSRAVDSNYTPACRSGLTTADTCSYIFTSGTTGLPKASLISHGKWLSTGYRWRCANPQQEDVFYSVLPLFHAAALMSMFSTVLSVGASSVLRRKFSASEFWQDIKKHQVTAFQYVGEICRYLVNRPEQEDEKNHNLRFICGAGMGLDVWNKFTKRFGDHIQIYEGWGATESNCNLQNLDNRPGSCGRVPDWDRSFIRHIKYDVENETHVRNSEGFMVQAEPGEVGEIIGLVQMGDGTPAAPFDGYSDKSATEKKLLRNVFSEGDCWFSSGDLFRRDEEDYFYFVDRTGDTFRWKSENVSTTEVAQQLSAYDGAELINIYGVAVPEHEGRAGMAALTLREGECFDPAAFYWVACESLPAYAVPLFVRVIGNMDLTGTFKLRKVDLQKQSYNPDVVKGELYLLDHEQRCYAPYSERGLAKLGVKSLVSDVPCT